jgi:hypothetical protein
LQKTAKKAVLEESDDDSEESDDDESEWMATRLYHSVADTAAAAKDKIADTITDWTSPQKKSPKGKTTKSKVSAQKRGRPSTKKSVTPKKMHVATKFKASKKKQHSPLKGKASSTATKLKRTASTLKV